jgi:HD-like signal output (HDOD) protein
LAPTYISGKGYIPAYGSSVSLETRGTAYAFVQSLAREVSGGSVDLPCFPDVVSRVRNALADPGITPEKTVKIVGTEPRLAANLLEMAGSVAFNPSGRPLKDLRTAVTRMGHQLVQSAAVSFAVQQMKEEELLRPIAKQLTELWKKSIAVASICQIVARRTQVSPDEAFLTGLLHAIGRLYIMVRAVGGARELCDEPNFVELVGGWHAPIGKAVLETWGFADEITQAVNDQAEYDRRSRRPADLSDVLVASIILADALELPAPRAVAINEVSAFQAIGMSEQDCTGMLAEAEPQLGSLQHALGCN